MAQIKIGRLVMGSVQTNFYFLYQEGSKEVICIDPADHGDKIYDKLTENGFAVKAILLTHAHFDHMLGAKELKRLTGAKIYANEAERVLCESADKNLSSQVGRTTTITPDIYLKDGEEITIAEMTFQVIATPGHTIGSCCYYFKEDNLLISGDTLFQESVGRTDLATGSIDRKSVV